MAFPAAGRTPAEILDELRARKRDDVRWAEGRVFAYVYDPGDEAMALLADAHRMYMTENGLDPTSFPSLLGLERDVIGKALALQRAPAGAAGSFTAGGTESILLSLKTVRDFRRETRPVPGRPEVVLPETAHAAFYKACAYFDLSPVRVPVDPVTLAADPRAIAAAIGENTILLVASAPSYAHGVVDPVGEIAELAARHRLHLHVDACVGGMYLPFLRELGHPLPEFDFALPGVTQLSMDFHKWGYAAKGASAILYRDAAMRRHQIFAWSGWTGYTVVNPTILSTRSGGPLAACWAILEHLGREGYLGLVDRAQRAALAIRSAIAAHPSLRVLGQPIGNLFAFTSDDRDVFAIADAMRTRGWYIQPQFGFGPSPANIHLSVGASNAPHADAFIADLLACTDAVGPAPAAEDLGLPPDAERMGFDGLAGWLGLNGIDLPDGMAPINRVLDQLPHPVRDGLLAEYVNRLYGGR